MVHLQELEDETKRGRLVFGEVQIDEEEEDEEEEDRIPEEFNTPEGIRNYLTRKREPLNYPE